VGIKLLGSLSRSITWKFKEEEERRKKNSTEMIIFASVFTGQQIFKSIARPIER
jgi:hypothetical protein